MKQWKLLNAMRHLLLGALLVAGGAHAANCSVAAGNIVHGVYTGVQDNSSATITVTCTRSTEILPRTTNFTITLSTGAGTYAQRLQTRSAAPLDTLNYNLYLTTVPGALNTNVWGNNTGGTIWATGSVSLNLLSGAQVRTFTVASAMAATGALPTAGSYSDGPIVVTLDYN